MTLPEVQILIEIIIKSRIVVTTGVIVHPSGTLPRETYKPKWSLTGEQESGNKILRIHGSGRKEPAEHDSLRK
ncbi:MAG TPA: hypothetical protein VN372_11730 [Methanospirillum sp.]|nr:hypothetical protein [Methanospirillum sp.]